MVAATEAVRRKGRGLEGMAKAPGRENDANRVDRL